MTSPVQRQTYDYLPSLGRHCPLVGTNLYYLVTAACVCKQHALINTLSDQDIYVGGTVVQWLERCTCDQQVVGSNPTLGNNCVTAFGKLFTHMFLCHQAV